MGKLDKLDTRKLAVIVALGAAVGIVAYILLT